MRSGAVDADRFKVEGRQPVHRRKMSKNSSVLNGADESLSYVVEDESMVRQVNLAAAYHDHISCTKSADLCKMDGIREGRGNLPCETDHIYANCSEIKNKSHNINAVPPSNNTKDLAIENMHLRDMCMSQSDMISHLQEELLKERNVGSQKDKEIKKLFARLKRYEWRMGQLQRRDLKSDDDLTPDRFAVRRDHSDSVTPVAAGSGEHLCVGTPVLATRYFGRKSKTIPSRALKRRYMGPPKNFPIKQMISKNESSAASLSSTSETLEELTEKRETNTSEVQETNGQEFPDPKRVRKKQDRKPKRLTRNADFLTTDKAYFLPDYRTLPQSFTSSEIDVPLWKLKPVTSFYQMEGTENINDPVFDRRHSKYELDERRRKRWDMQRLREQKANEKLKNKQNRDAQKRKSQSFYPDPRHIEYVEVTEQLPVLAFGHLIPLFQPCEFSVPWHCAETPSSDLSNRSSCKGKRGRPSTPALKVT